MNMSKIAMLAAAALVGAGICAAEPADAPKPESGKPAMRGGRRGMMQAFQLTAEEKAALKASDDAVKTQAKAIREKARAEIKALLEKSFDEQLRTLKTAAARLTDKEAKAKAEKALERMEGNRDRLLDMKAARLLAGDRPMFGGRRGPRPEGDAPRGPRGPQPPMDKE